MTATGTVRRVCAQVALSTLVAVAGAGHAGADPATPAVDPASARGKAILAVATADLTSRLGKPAALAPEVLNAVEGFAFVNAKITDVGGGAFDYSGTPFAEDAANGMKSKRYVGLFRASARTWKRVDSVVGPTDVAWDGWAQEYGAPAAVFPTG